MVTARRLISAGACGREWRRECRHNHRSRALRANRDRGASILAAPADRRDPAHPEQTQPPPREPATRRRSCPGEADLCRRQRAPPHLPTAAAGRHSAMCRFDMCNTMTPRAVRRDRYPATIAGAAVTMAGNHVDRKFARGIARLLQFAWQSDGLQNIDDWRRKQAICPIARCLVELRLKK